MNQNISEMNDKVDAEPSLLSFKMDPNAHQMDQNAPKMGQYTACIDGNLPIELLAFRSAVFALVYSDCAVQFERFCT